ncbi:glycosyltransferase family A protein, partial [Catenibacterium sp.]
MKLSIIIPFNRYIHYLYDCLESIKDQNLTDYEVLLVVDAIEDVKDKIHKYNLPITLIESGEATVGKKRNMGLNLAKGDYVYFLDSDDYVLPNCLNALMEEAEKSNNQVVAGKRMVSWFKKKVYETMSDETNIERNLKDKDHDRLIKVERKQEEHVYDNEPEQFKIDLLIRTRHALRNVSCLNLLIKRSLIEDNHISFKEEFFWYTDAPFVVELLKYTNDVSFVEDAILVKRKHNDPINRPALSQIKDPDGRFDEFIEAHNYCLEISKDYPSIHYYINAKMANYFTSFFAKKVRRSEDDKWRTTRFDTMAEVLTRIEPELLKKSLYRR